MATERSVAELAERLGGQAEGNLQARLSGVAPLETAGETELSFVESERNREEALASRAGCLLAPPGLNLPGKTAIRVRNPRYAMAQAVELFHPARASTAGIHATALIGAGAVIGKEVSIGPYVVVGAGSRIGARTRIGAGCV
ncbi:MAG TPA: LpxD N-terminal domain-containing protein, partial [Terriglobia bacterium]|nr:LpxD N-terminal domain-containing protein [Terriglobia bacterium]